MAKYHLGKVKLERVGQRSLPTPVRDLRGGPRGIAGLLMCAALLLELRCIVALLANLADQFLPSCESLRILAPSPPFLPGVFVSIFSAKYSLR